MTSAYHHIIPLEVPRVLGAPEALGGLDFLRGTTLETRPVGPWNFNIELKGPRPPHLLGGAFPMASQQLLKVLTDAGVDNLQVFPAVLQLSGGTWRQHAVFNVIGLVDAAESPEPLIISRARTRDLPAFRLFGHADAVLVHDRVQRALDSHRPPEGWGFSAFELEMCD